MCSDNASHRWAPSQLVRLHFPPAIFTLSQPTACEMAGLRSLAGLEPCAPYSNQHSQTQLPGAPQRRERERERERALHNAPFCPRACFEKQTLRNDARLILTRLRDVRSRKPNSKISNGNNEHFHAMLPLKTPCKFANFAISHTCCN